MNGESHHGGRSSTFRKWVAAGLIAGLLAGLGGVGICRIHAESARVEAAEKQFDRARSTAIGKGTTAQVIVDFDDPAAAPELRDLHRSMR